MSALEEVMELLWSIPQSEGKATLVVALLASLWHRVSTLASLKYVLLEKLLKEYKENRLHKDRWVRKVIQPVQERLTSNLSPLLFIEALYLEREVLPWVINDFFYKNVCSSYRCVPDIKDKTLYVTSAVHKKLGRLFSFCGLPLLVFSGIYWVGYLCRGSGVQYHRKIEIDYTTYPERVLKAIFKYGGK